MTTTIVFSNADDGYMTSGPSATYSAALNGDGLVRFPFAAVTYWGQQYTGSAYNVWQSFLSFAYTPVAGEAITSAYVELHTFGTTGTSVSRNMEIREYDWGGGTLDNADWRTPAALAGLPLHGNVINGEDANGTAVRAGRDVLITRLGSAGPYRCVVVSSRNTNSNAPTDDEYASFQTADESGTADDPQLVFTSVPLSQLYRVLGAQVQLSDGTHVLLEYNDVPDPTLDAGAILLQFHDNTGITTVATIPNATPVCVDAATEIYTRSGWKTHDRLQVGDETRAINPATGLGEWVEVYAVRRFEAVHDVIRIEGAGFSALATLSHRWLVQRDGEWVWRTTPELVGGDFIPTDSTPVAVADLTMTADRYDGIVWCPTTGHGNWLARRNGTAYYTGNKPA